MLNFKCDYLVGAHPKILEKFMETNMEVCTPYGNDVYSQSAKKKIIEACGNPNAEVHLLTGGTQTNKIVISAMLQSHEGVIAAVSGHIAQHEAGAIEASGHKVLQIPGKDGKLCAEDVEKYIENFYAGNVAQRGKEGNIWYSPEWSTSPTPRSTELYTRKRS